MMIFKTQKCEVIGYFVGINHQYRLKQILHPLSHAHPPHPTPLYSFALFVLSFGVVVLEQDSAAAQQYSRQGCPTGLRADLWALILNSTNQPQVLYAYIYIRTNTQLSWRLSVFVRKQMCTHSCGDSQTACLLHGFQLQ